MRGRLASFGEPPWVGVLTPPMADPPPLASDGLFTSVYLLSSPSSKAVLRHPPSLQLLEAGVPHVLRRRWFYPWVPLAGPPSIKVGVSLDVPWQSQSSYYRPTVIAVPLLGVPKNPQNVWHWVAVAATAFRDVFRLQQVSRHYPAQNVSSFVLCVVLHSPFLRVVASLVVPLLVH